MEKINLSDIELSKQDIEKNLLLPTSTSCDLAYLCGIIVGDGSISERPDKKEYSLKIVGNPRDEQSLYHQVIGPKFRKIFGFTPKIGFMDTKTTYGFIIYSKALFIFLTKKISLISGRKDQRLGIPNVFQNNDKLIVLFLQGLFDTDGCISFKKKYKATPYYPVITLASSSEKLIREVSTILKDKGFKIAELYNYKNTDSRTKYGFTTINRIDINGFKNLDLWLKKINFSSPKHIEKIKRYYKSGCSTKLQPL